MVWLWYRNWIFKGHNFFLHLYFQIIILCSSYSLKIESIFNKWHFFSFILIVSITYCLSEQQFFIFNIPLKEGHSGQKTYYIDFSILEIFQFSATISVNKSRIFNGK